MPTKRTSEKPADKKGGKNNQNSSQSTNSNMSKSAEHSYGDNRDTFCSMCDHEVSDDDPCIQCELCESWFCLECIGMSEAFYNELVSSSHGDNVIWYCNGCKRAIPGVRKVLNAVTSIHTLQENMNKRLTSLEEKVNSKPSELSMDYKIDQAMYDFKEREKRRNNVIIYNLPEPSAEDNESKLEEEKEKINKICDHAEITSGFETASRLGEKRNEASNPRPLKVVLSDENSKQKLLKKSDSLKNVEELKKVTVTPDYTYRQRQMNKTMKQEVAKRRVTDPTYNYRKLKQELQTMHVSSAETPANQSEDLALIETPEEFIQQSQGHASRVFERSSFDSRSANKGRTRGDSQAAKPYLAPNARQAAKGRGAPLGRGSGTLSARR